MEATNSALVLPSEASEESLSDIHDIRSLVEAPSSWSWIWWVIGGLLLLALAYWAYLYWRKHRKPETQEPSQPTEPAHERARRQLERALEHLHDPDQFCVMVSDAIRVYLEQRYDLHAPDRTTEEFLEELPQRDCLSAQQQQSLAHFLSECDLVKFARSEPEAYELKRLYESALQLVRETEPSLLAGEATDPSEGTS